jgi:hypothetical protein
MCHKQDDVFRESKLTVTHILDNSNPDRRYFGSLFEQSADQAGLL